MNSVCPDTTEETIPKLKIQVFLAWESGPPCNSQACRRTHRTHTFFNSRSNVLDLYTTAVLFGNDLQTRRMSWNLSIKWCPFFFPVQSFVSVQQ
jgi:hypothetical protein